MLRTADPVADRLLCMSETEHPGCRFVFLVIVPTGFALVPWALVLSPETLPGVPFVFVGGLPLLGLLPVLGYRWLTLEQVWVLPYVPAAAIPGFLVALTVDDVVAAILNEPGSEYLLMALIPILVLTQPVFILAGGLTSFLFVNGRPRPVPAGR